MSECVCVCETLIELLSLAFLSVFRATTPSRPDSPAVLPGNVSVNLQPRRRLKSAARVPPVLRETSLAYVMPR